MNKGTVRARIEEIGIVPAIRLASAQFAVDADTVIDTDTARRCLEAGAKFLSSRLAS
jgi:hypothetical protein